MDLIYDLNIVVIYGGRNDHNHDIRESIYNDLYVLNLQTLTWMEVKLEGYRLNNICSHSTYVVSSQIIIYGGHQLSQYSNSNFIKIEFNQNKINQVMRFNKKTKESDYQNYITHTSNDENKQIEYLRNITKVNLKNKL